MRVALSNKTGDTITVNGGDILRPLTVVSVPVTRYKMSDLSKYILKDTGKHIEIHNGISGIKYISKAKEKILAKHGITTFEDFLNMSSELVSDLGIKQARKEFE